MTLYLIVEAEQDYQKPLWNLFDKPLVRDEPRPFTLSLQGLLML